MKFRLIAIIALAFCCAAPWTMAQNPPSASPSPSTFPGSTTSQQTDSAPPKATTAPVQGADPDKIDHDGGRKDVDAIGTRHVGCDRGMGNWYSLEKQIGMGKQYSMMVESQSKMITDPVITEYVNRVGQNIVRNSDAQVPFTIKVIDDDSINAMALPGGFFYVNTGLILAADGEAELAGVMAHEIAHVAACHAARENTRGNLMNIASIPLIMVGGPIGYAAYEGAGLALPLTFLKFSRTFEAEADYLGLQYMYKSGYDPQAFVAFFEKIEALEKKKPGTLSKAFASHPQTPDRITKSQEEIAQILPARPEYTVTTSEFDDVKGRLASIENRHKITDTKDKGKPSLRRTSATDKNGSDDKTTSDDGRPTLKRRPDDSN
ncbi:MAG TPA: M48 family metallopeptidase [Terriglobales bacterium]|nr:M48 family metallopeptidase [Terriglobales bacterium]